MNSQRNRNTGRVSEGSSKNEELHRSAVRRKKRRRRKDFFTFAVLLILIAAVVTVLSFTVLFKTEKIAFENEALRYSDAEILDAAQIKTGDNMFRISTVSVEKRIEKALPYIGHAEIKRSLPDTVIISVEYTSAAMAAEYNGAYILMNTTGKVLENNVSQLTDCIAEINGVEVTKGIVGEQAEFSDENVLANVIELATLFEKYELNNITGYNFENLNNITVEVDYKIDVKLGSMTNAEHKLNFGKEVILRNLNSAYTSKIIIDLTSDKTAYVRTQDNIDAASEAASRVQDESVNGTTVPETGDGSSDN